MDYSVSEARSGLPGLIDKALSGERVVITRHGQPVAELKARPAADKQKADLGWLGERRRGRRISVSSLDILAADASESRW